MCFNWSKVNFFISFKKLVSNINNVHLPYIEDFSQRYQDYSTGYASVPGLAYERAEWVTEIEGEIPPELEGTLLRNGPAMYERGKAVQG